MIIRLCLSVKKLVFGPILKKYLFVDASWKNQYMRKNLVYCGFQDVSRRIVTLKRNIKGVKKACLA